MGNLKVNVKAEVVGVQMTCIHCNDDIQDGDCVDIGDTIAVDLTLHEDECNMVLSDVICPSCGSNTFTDVIGYVNVTVE